MTPPNPRIRVLLAEDHTLVRAGIRALLDAISGVEVVAEVANGRDAVDAVARSHPDVVLMDITMPELNGLDATGRIVKAFPGVRVLVLSMHGDPEYVGRALEYGAAGYLLKEASSHELEMAIHAVARGRRYLSPAVAADVVDRYVTGARPPGSPLDRLTPRQREVLQLIAEGNATKEIATKLGVSPKTVETHRAQLMERLQIHEVAGLVRFAVRSGLVQLTQ